MLHDYHFGGCSQKLTFKQSSAFQALGLMACLYFVSVCSLHKSFVLLIMNGELKEKINITTGVLLARPGRKQATVTEDNEFHISYL